MLLWSASLIELVCKSIHLEDYKMDNRIYDEKNSLWYEKQGDYYIPCIELCEKETQYIGMWDNGTQSILKDIIECGILTC